MASGDSTLYVDKDVLLTAENIQFGQNIYKLSDISSANLQTTSPERFKRYWRWSNLLLILLVGIAALLTLSLVNGLSKQYIFESWRSITWGDFLIVVNLLIVIALTLLRRTAVVSLRTESYFSLHLFGRFGEVIALSSTDQGYVQKTLLLVKQAIGEAK